MDRGRREFFADLLRQGVRALGELRQGLGPPGPPGPPGRAQAQDPSGSFFDSYESSYALTLAYPDEILIESARRAGIETQGRERIDIVKELFAKQGREA